MSAVLQFPPRRERTDADTIRAEIERQLCGLSQFRIRAACRRALNLWSHHHELNECIRTAVDAETDRSPPPLAA